MKSSQPRHVAIIGGGPAGLCLAIGLRKQNIACTIYELRGPNHREGGGFVLSPNALKVLNSLGLYERLVPQGFQFEHSSIVDEHGELLGRLYYGHKEKYGYKALRLRRQTLSEEATRFATDLGVEIRYNSRFTRVVAESERDVSFEINGQIEHAETLIGADGIFSSVRKHFGTFELTYGGILGIVGDIPISKVRFPQSEHSLPYTVKGKKGALMMVPEDPKATVMMAGSQLSYPEHARAEWADLAADKDKLLEILRRDYDTWDEVGKSTLDALGEHKDTLFIWPFYSVPTLDSWASPNQRVILVGDAAHAVPPSSGQGVSQALEDVYTLSLLLGSGIGLSSSLEFWQSWRKARIERILKIVKLMNFSRLSEDEMKKEVETLGFDVGGVDAADSWYGSLFKTDIDAEIKAWIDSHRQ